MASRALTIAVDGRELMGHPTGVGRYTTEILRVWTTLPAFPHRICVVVPAAPEARLNFGPRVTFHVEAGRSAGTWWEQTSLPKAVKGLGADVLFSPGYTAPLRSGCPVVLAVHDVSFFAHPEWFSWREGLRRRWLTRWSARRASAVVTLSNFSASEIRRYLGVAAGRVVLAPPGVSSKAGAAIANEPSGGVAAAAPAAVPPARQPVVLYVGSIFERRRIPDLLLAFSHVLTRVPDARLVLIGESRMRPAYDPMAGASALGIGGAVTWRRYVADAELDVLYDQARVFAFLSEYEGFAMTPAEALARGAAPVLLDTPVAREVYGDGARLVPPNPAAIAGAIAELLTDEAARQAVVRAGQRQLGRYSWGASAAAVRQALETAAG